MWPTQWWHMDVETKKVDSIVLLEAGLVAEDRLWECIQLAASQQTPDSLPCCLKEHVCKESVLQTALSKLATVGSHPRLQFTMC